MYKLSSFLCAVTFRHLSLHPLDVISSLFCHTPYRTAQSEEERSTNQSECGHIQHSTGQQERNEHSFLCQIFTTFSQPFPPSQNRHQSKTKQMANPAGSPLTIAWIRCAGRCAHVCIHAYMNFLYTCVHACILGFICKKSTWM